MSGEYINANSIEDYWKELKTIYLRRSTKWKDLSAEEYDAIEHSEHSDSDNEFNLDRLGKETQVIDVCHYKYLPKRVVAYKVEIRHQDGTKKEYYFQINLADKID